LGRYCYKNTGPQCRKCNRFREGNKAGFALYLIRQYGVEVIAELDAYQHQTKRWKVPELQALIIELRDKLSSNASP
jgi:hypothetical protein